MRAIPMAALSLFAVLAACGVEGEDDARLQDDAELFIDDALPPPPILSVLGACPGPATVSLSSLTPFGSYALVVSPNLAPGVLIPSGPCAGTPMRVGPPASLGPTGTANAGGMASFPVTLPPAACGKYVQPIDISTCSQGMYIQL